MKPSVRRFNRETRAARDVTIEAYETRLAEAYAATIVEMGVQAAEAFSLTATPLDNIPALVADANEPPASETGKDPKFVAPDSDEVLKRDRMAADVMARVAEIKVEASILLGDELARRLGITFDMPGFFSETLFKQAGKRAIDIDASMHDAVVSAIRVGLEEGYSIPDTAALIRENVDEMSGYTARMLARTDMIGMSNAGSLQAARLVYPDGGIQKEWLATEDERTRETHVEADGQIVPLDQPFRVGADSLDYPGDPSGSDAEVCNCRCTVIYKTVAQAAAPPPEITADAVDHSEGSMVCVMPTPEQAARIGRYGGQAYDTLHVTLAFLPSGLDDQQCDALVAELGRVARKFETLEGAVSGFGQFAVGDDGVPLLALPSVHDLDRLRVECTRALDRLGIEYAQNWGWVPHMTVGYDAVENHEAVTGEALSFGAVTLVRGTDRYDMPFGDMEEEAPMDTDELTAAVTVTVEDGADDAAAATPRKWKATLLREEAPTEDGRMLAAGSISWRDLPLTLMGLIETGPGGHQGAEVCGRMDVIGRENDLILSTGDFNTDEFATKVADMVENQSLRGVSVDLAILDYEIRDRDTGKVLTPEEEIEYWLDGKPTLFVVTDAVIGMATVCPFQAIADATIELVADGGERYVLGEPTHRNGALTMKVWAPLMSELEADAVSDPALNVPLHPPVEWFKDPQLAGPTPLTVSDDGYVYGHLGLWGHCHGGNPQGPGVCTMLPHADYSHFHLGELVCDGGERVSVGALTLDGSHAGKGKDPRTVRLHYDSTGHVAADVRIGEDAFGVWFAGALRPDESPERVRALRASKISGDWRTVDGKLSLIAALCVNVGGFEVPRPEVLLASGEDGNLEIRALTAAGMWSVEDQRPAVSARALIEIEAAAMLDGLDGLVALMEQE